MSDQTKESISQPTLESKASFWNSIWDAIAPDWHFVLTEVLRPVPLCLILFTLILGIVQINLAGNGGTSGASNTGAVSLSTLALLVISVASSILGAIIHDRWKQIQEQSILTTKGKSALRGLQILLIGTRNQKRKIEEYKDTIARSGDTDKQQFEMILRELEHSSANLPSHVLNALAEWGDILPASVYSIQEKVDAFEQTEQELNNTKVQLEVKADMLTKLENESHIDKKSIHELHAEMQNLSNRLDLLQEQKKRQSIDLNFITSPTIEEVILHEARTRGGVGVPIQVPVRTSKMPTPGFLK